MLDNINVILGIGFTISLVVSIILGIMSVITIDDSDYNEPRKKWAKLFKCYVLPLFFITSLIGTFLPTTNQMAMIYVIPKLSNSDFMKKIPAKLELLANKEIDKLLKNVEK
jgi:hypothetical protein